MASETVTAYFGVEGEATTAEGTKVVLRYENTSETAAGLITVTVTATAGDKVKTADFTLRPTGNESAGLPWLSVTLKFVTAADADRVASATAALGSTFEEAAANVAALDETSVTFSAENKTVVFVGSVEADVTQYLMFLLYAQDGTELARCTTTVRVSAGDRLTKEIVLSSLRFHTVAITAAEGTALDAAVVSAGTSDVSHPFAAYTKDGVVCVDLPEGNFYYLYVDDIRCSKPFNVPETNSVTVGDAQQAPDDSAYHSIFREDFDNLSDVSGIAASATLMPILVDDGAGGTALCEDATAVMGYRGGFTVNPDNPKDQFWHISYDGPYTVEFDLKLDGLVYTSFSSYSHFYLYNSATDARMSSGGFSLNTTNGTEQLTGNPPNSTMKNWVWHFSADSPWLESGVTQHYKIFVDYNAEPGASIVQAYVDGKLVGTANDIGGGDVQGVLLEPARGTAQTIDNIVIKAAKPVSPAVQVTAASLTGVPYVPAGTMATVRLTGSTSFKALRDDTDVSSWFNGLPAGFTATLSGAVTEGGIRARVAISGIFANRAGSSGGISVTVPDSVVNAPVPAAVGDFGYDFASGEASMEVSGKNIVLGNTDAAQYEYIIRLTNNSFVSTDVQKHAFLVNAGDALITVESVTVDEELTSATMLVSVAPQTSGKGTVTFSIASDALADKRALSVGGITYEYLDGGRVWLVSPADAKVPFSVAGRAVGEHITVIRLLNVALAKNIAAGEKVATIAPDNVDARSLTAVAKGETEIPVYFTTDAVASLGVTLADGIATTTVAPLEASSDYAGCAYEVTYVQDYEDGAEVDWTAYVPTTRPLQVTERYAPMLVSADGNTYLTVTDHENVSVSADDTNARNNNGAMLTSPSLEIPAGRNFQLSFDVKIGGGNNMPSSFSIADAARGGTMLSIVQQSAAQAMFVINDGKEPTEIPGMYVDAVNRLSSLAWYTVTLERAASDTYVTIVEKGGGEVFPRRKVSASESGGLSSMTFNTGRYYANFAIDNIIVCSAPNSSQ